MGIWGVVLYCGISRRARCVCEDQDQVALLNGSQLGLLPPYCPAKALNTFYWQDFYISEPSGQFLVPPADSCGYLLGGV